MGQGRALKSLPAPTRRSVLAAASGAGFAALAPWASGCARHEAKPSYDGGWIGASVERGHLLRSGWPQAKSGGMPPVAMTRRVGAVVVGGGVAGLTAARSLAAAGVDDVHVLELEDSAGGHSRGHAIAGMRCPLGAHYLPLPGAHATEVADLLDELGVRTVRNGRAEYDERMLCHSPQERIHIGGGWRDGLLPPLEALPAADRDPTAAAYRRFAAAVRDIGGGGGRDGGGQGDRRNAPAFAVPTTRSRWSAALAALDSVTFAAWLDAHGFVAPALRWYLDYCCRDDYGAAAAQVSAWAGLHYFASRHGFDAPEAGSDERGKGDDEGAVLTWPEGNAFLIGKMAASLGDRSHAGRVVLRVAERRDGVEIDAWNAASAARERWLASQVVLATPLFVSARIVEQPPAALLEAARAIRYAPWLVANLHLASALEDRPGAPPSWDNVVYGSPALGYVDAMHQSMRPHPGPTVLTAYWALGGASAAELAAARARLLGDDWRSWAARVVADLSAAHPDLESRVARIDLMRYGHAMAVPAPGARTSAAAGALAALAAPQPGRLHFAHGDLSAYSVFEEAIHHGSRAGRAAAGRKPA